MVAPPVPVLSTSAVTPSGYYARWRGRWLPAVRRGIRADGRAWTLRVPAGDDVPDGFVASGREFGSAGSGTVDAAEVEAVCRVQTQCLWKNHVWWVEAVDGRTGEVMLHRWSSADLPDFVPIGPGPSPQTFELGRLPGVFSGDHTPPDFGQTVRARVTELARVGSRVWPAGIVNCGEPAVVAASGAPGSQVAVTSIPESPWLTSDDARVLVLMHGQPTDLELDGPMHAERWRDGWFVWAGDGVVRWGEHDQRVSESSWIVADDRVVLRCSGTSRGFGTAPQHLTDGMFQRTLQISREVGLDAPSDGHAQPVSGPTVPLDGRMLYPSGGYVLWRGRWFLRSTSRRRAGAGSVKLGVGAGEPIPEGFDAVAGPRAFDPVAERTVAADEIDAVCGVHATCTWKNSPWEIGFVDRAKSTALLTIASTVPRWYRPVEPSPHWTDFANWPGVDGGDREWTSVQVRPREAARVQLELIRRSVTTLTENENADDIAWGIPVESMPLSPWLSGDAAVAVVKESLIDADMEGYPVGELLADRLRDGWRVWAPPPRDDDALGIRMGWAVWYVADDGVVWASSTSTSVEQASARMTDELWGRLQEGAR